MTPEDAGALEEARREWEERTLKPALARVPRPPGPLRGFERRAARARLHARATPRRSTTSRDLGLPGRVPVHARRPAHDVPRAALDDAPVRGLRLGGRDQPALPLSSSSRGRPGSRSPSTCRPRWATTPTHAMARSEVGKVGVADLERRGHGSDLFDGHPARPRLDLDDDQRHRGHPALRSTSRWRERQGVPSERLSRHDPERHPEGVHRARHLHLPARRRRCG